MMTIGSLLLPRSFAGLIPMNGVANNPGGYTAMLIFFAALASAALIFD